jgi:hypothetical protein
MTLEIESDSPTVFPCSIPLLVSFHTILNPSPSLRFPRPFVRWRMEVDVIGQSVRVALVRMLETGMFRVCCLFVRTYVNIVSINENGTLCNTE